MANLREESSKSAGLVWRVVGKLRGSACVVTPPAAAVLSAAVFALFWDGTRRNLSGQGWIGVLIDLAILAAVIAGWPSVG